MLSIALGAGLGFAIARSITDFLDGRPALGVWSALVSLFILVALIFSFAGEI